MELVGTARFASDIKLDMVKNNTLSRAQFSIAVNPRRNNEKVAFYNCTALGKTAELMNQFTEGNAKGREVWLSGFMEFNNYEKDVNGTMVKMQSHSLLVDEFKLFNNGQPKTQNQNGYQQQQQQPQQQPQQNGNMNRGQGFNSGQSQQPQQPNNSWPQQGNTWPQEQANFQRNNNAQNTSIPPISDDDVPF